MKAGVAGVVESWWSRGSRDGEEGRGSKGGREWG